MSDEPFCEIDEALADLRAGRMVILCDDQTRENEGDLVCAAEKITAEIVNFMLTHGRGLLCLSLTRDRCEQLNLHPQATDNTSRFGTAFMTSVDAHPRFGVSTGVSAADRATTIQAAVAPDARPADLVRPGHISPLMARDGGVLVRAGQTEGSVDLARLAGLAPAGVLIEIMNPDGTMARLPQLAELARRFELKLCTVADLIRYRQRREHFVHRVETITLPTRYGTFALMAYTSIASPRTNVALVYGGIGRPGPDGKVAPVDEPVLVRVHSECLFGDAMGSLRCDCGDQLSSALKQIVAAGRGVLVYLRQEGRGIGLAAKCRAYALQEQGLDTVEANEQLGFPADKRDFGIGAQILCDLGVRKIRVMTNNPKKVTHLEVYGLEVVEQVPIEIPPTDHNLRYLQTKRDKMGHQLRNV